MRLHPYHTERVLSRSPFLSALSPIAGAHHERIDGSGYHRGASGRSVAFPARLLAAADAYHAMTELRPHREALPPEQAAQVLAEEVSAGRLDPDAVAAVLEAAGQRAPRLERPAGLTEREAEVVAMLARGLQTKQVARALGISVKTADRHIQNAYRKIGVSSRAAATVFAMEHGLVAWGELPIARSAAPLSLVELDNRRAQPKRKEDAMATETLDRYRREILDIAEAIAPTWERRRADIEEVATPVREWMLRELRAQEETRCSSSPQGPGIRGSRRQGSLVRPAC